MLYTQKFISLLRCQSLERVMAANGYYPHHEHKNRAYYHCPFHNDEHPSFSIELKDADGVGAVQRFVCPSCKTGGSGTLELQALFSGLDKDSEEVILKVASIFSLVAEGKEEADFYSRRKEAAPQLSYTFEYNETFSDNDLEALGCRRKMIYRSEFDEEGNTIQRPLLDKQNNPRYAYSWGDNYYRKEIDSYLADDKYSNFVRQELTRVFNLRSVKSFVTAQKKNSKGETKSYRIESSNIYPIFNFVYGDKKNEWGKKYEPYYRPGHKGVKFMFWYGSGMPHPNIGTQIYGDVDVMNYLAAENVEDIKETKTGNKAEGLFSHVEQDANGNPVTTKVFHHLVICSGPRDALSVYFHSSAHVVWFNSENTDFSREVFRRLKACCEHLYICYDIDKTGIDGANEMAMKHLGIRVIRLPKILSTFVDRRTGKPGKDAENFFNLYRTDDKKERFRFYGNVEDRFATLMKNSIDMKFFIERWRERKAKSGVKDGYITYEISGNSAIQLASARGIYRYNLDDNRHIYVRCKENIVDIIPEKDIVRCVRKELKDFVEVLPDIKSYTKLCDAITKSGNLDKGTCEQLEEIDLNLRSWDADTEYIALQNCVVKVTQDEIVKMRYDKVPYHFFRQAIVEKVTPTNTERRMGRPPYQNIFQKVEEPTFRIYRNEEQLQAKRKEIDDRMTRGMNDDEKEVLESQYLEFEKLWGWKLEWLKPYEQQPIVVRFVYETGRIYWRKEQKGIRLTEVEQQEQNLHFIVKCNAFGYTLSRHRDPAKAFIVQWTDFSSIAEGKSSGRTGKSALANLIMCLRNIHPVNGKEIKTRENFAKNFAQFQLYVHSNIIIDDLELNISAEQFYNLNTSMRVKTLYEDELIIPSDVCPKVVLTSNKDFDRGSSSTAGRFMMSPVGGPIGHHKINGQTVITSIFKMFGVIIPDGLVEHEYNLCQNFLMWCLQFYFGHKDIIYPYMGHEGLASMAAQQVNNKDFTSWANDYFSDESRFGAPLSRREMFLDYMEYCGKVTDIHSNNVAMAEFKELLRKYCNAFQYALMPSICYKGGKEDLKDGSIRMTTWITKKDSNGFRMKPLQWEWVKSERCIYVFQSASDIPPTNEDLQRPDKQRPPVIHPEEEGNTSRNIS